MARRTLLIDDTADVRAVVRHVFELAGFEVVGEAVDGAEGVEKAVALQPDVIVVDWQMPVLEGIDALPHLREAVPLAVIIMFSSRPDADARDRALAAGADAYAEKGAAPQEVAALAQRLLEG